jgi:hypothetical protein
MADEFIKQYEIQRNLVSVVVPQETNPPNRFSFHHFVYDQEQHPLNDDAEISDGIRTFKIKDGVLGAFETVAWPHFEFGWSFASSKIVDVLAAVKIGETLDVKFVSPFGEVYKISRYHFPSGVADSGYGQYRIHICEDVVRPSGFRIVSSFEEGQEPTKSRLPFFFGFRVFGSEEGTDADLIWRSFLGLSIRYCQEEKWHLSILHSAFCLESFIDTLLKNRMLNGGLPEDYIEHILRVGEKRDEFQALNEMLLKDRFKEKEINRRYDDVNKKVFKKRNSLAHGKSSDTSITNSDAIEAIRTVVAFVWDFDEGSRRNLLIVTGPTSFERMIDDSLLQACKGEI